MRVSVKTTNGNLVYFLPHQVITIFDTYNRSFRVESQFSILIDEKEIDDDFLIKIGTSIIKGRDDNSIKEVKIDIINKNISVIKKNN